MGISAVDWEGKMVLKMCSLFSSIYEWGAAKGWVLWQTLLFWGKSRTYTPRSLQRWCNWFCSTIRSENTGGNYFLLQIQLSDHLLCTINLCLIFKVLDKDSLESEVLTSWLQWWKNLNHGNAVLSRLPLARLRRGRELGQSILKLIILPFQIVLGNH